MSRKLDTRVAAIAPVGVATRRRPKSRGLRGTGSVSVSVSVSLAVVALLTGGGVARAQVLINEVLADNATVPPLDIGVGFRDMVELVNVTDEIVRLGTGTRASSYLLSDSPLETFDDARAWAFPSERSNLAPRGRLVIFCDGDIARGTCELHASFSIASDGTEAITLWGPETSPGVRPMVDRVCLPALPPDVSFGRFPDASGPANIPCEDTFDHFCFFRGDPSGPSRPTFGTCVSTAGVCLLGTRRFCGGAPNSSTCANLPPSITRIAESTNAPAAGETVDLVARVRDDKTPLSPNLARVEVVYRVRAPDGSVSPDVVLPMSYDLAGVRSHPLRPLDRFTHWTASLPGQTAGSSVEFYLLVEDAEGLRDQRPDTLCAEGIGPCDREFGGPGCELDLTDRVNCDGPDAQGLCSDQEVYCGERYLACNKRWTYTVGYTPRAGVAGVIINEVVPLQTNLLLDRTERPCVNSGGVSTCPPGMPDCCKTDEDFIELLNTSGAAVDLTGCWLSDSFYSPDEGWQFPADSVLQPGERVIVWLDSDGSKCPDPQRFLPPCWWECPDPNDVSIATYREWHANFAINADGDQVYLFDDAAHGFGVIDGLDFSIPAEFPGFTANVEVDDGMGGVVFTNPGLQVLANQSLSRIPDGDPDGCWVIAARGTPKEVNTAEATCNTDVVFRRGDSNGGGGLDLTDAIFTLNYLFMGGLAPRCLDAADSNDDGSVDLTDGVYSLNFLFTGGMAPPAPGPQVCGPDPTEDQLSACEYDCT